MLRSPQRPLAQVLLPWQPTDRPLMIGPVPAPRHAASECMLAGPGCWTQAGCSCALQAPVAGAQSCIMTCTQSAALRAQIWRTTPGKLMDILFALAAEWQWASHLMHLMHVRV